MRYPRWTARGKWRCCQRFASRGEIFCADCATAEVVPAEPGRLEGFLTSLRSFTLTLAKRPA